MLLIHFSQSTTIIGPEESEIVHDIEELKLVNDIEQYVSDLKKSEDAQLEEELSNDLDNFMDKVEDTDESKDLLPVEDSLNLEDLLPVADSLNTEALLAKTDEKFLDDVEVLLKRILEEKEKRGDECKDINQDCYELAQAGKCVEDVAFMSQKCRKTCMHCCGDVMEESQCKKYVDNTMCTNAKYISRLKFICAKSCGFCGEANTELPCVNSEFGCCWNGVARKYPGPKDSLEGVGCKDCDNHQSSIFCKRQYENCHDDMQKRLCPKTCGVCGVDRRCEDKLLDIQCVNMKSQAMCENKAAMMSYYCPQTCNFCKACRDTHSNCKMWAGVDACVTEKTMESMKKLCPKSCGVC